MPSYCIRSSRFQSLLIVLIIYFEETCSTNDHQHEIVKADVGQDVTMSCIFDEDKIEQVRTNQRRENLLFLIFGNFEKKKNSIQCVYRKTFGFMYCIDCCLCTSNFISGYSSCVEKNLNCSCNGSLFIIR